MKNLKIKFGLFSLLAILAVSVFLTSCEQEAIVPSNPLALQDSNQDMSKVDLEAYHNYLNSISKEDFEINEDVYAKIDGINSANSQVQITNIVPLMKLNDDTSKDVLLSVLSNENMITASGEISSPKFSTFKDSDIIEIAKELMNTGNYAVLVNSKINDISVKSIAIVGKEGFVWDNIYSLIDVKEQTANEFELSMEEFKSDIESLEKNGDGGCVERGWKLDLGRNLFDGVVSTAFIRFELCWDCNGNFSENDSRIIHRYCNSLPGSDCATVGGIVSGWGTDKLKVFLGGEYAPPGISLSISKGPVQLNFTPGSLSGLDAYGEVFTHAGNTNCGSCLRYNTTNYFPSTGNIDVYGQPASWVRSHKFNMFIKLYDETDICDYGVSFQPNEPICGRTGKMWDNDVNDLYLWESTSNGWERFSIICFSGLATEDENNGPMHNGVHEYSLESTPTPPGPDFIPNSGM